MKKLLFIVICLSSLSLHADEVSAHNSPLTPRINRVIKYPAMGIGVGFASGALCGLVDGVTRDSLWIFSWISTMSLRELIIMDILSNDPAFKDNSDDRKKIANITGHLSAWIAYCIVRGALK